MRKIRNYLYCILLSLLIIYLQKNLFLDARGLIKPPVGFSESYLFSSLVLGLIFGLISCPICGLPLSFALASTENKLSSLVFKNILFHLSRFLVIFVYAFLGNFLLRQLDKFFYNLSFLLGGMVMIFMGLIILRIIKFRFFCFKPGKDYGLNSFLYLIFGLSLGFACGFEATGFLVPLWLSPNYNYLIKSTGLFIFSFSAILPTLVMSVLFYLGFQGIIFLFKEKSRFFLVNTAGFFLLILGFVFIVSFFR